jgi:hypothetical protein
MMEWFSSGGFGMFLVLAFGAASIGYGAKATQTPTAERVETLRALPALLFAAGTFAFGVNMWAVNRALESDSFQKARHLTAADMPLLGIIGVTESVQVLTLAGLLAAFIVGLRILATRRLAA